MTGEDRSIEDACNQPIEQTRRRRMSSTSSLLSAAVVLCICGGAAPALASDHNGQEHSYGGPVQTWCDINPDCNGWNKGLHRTSYDTVAPSVAPKQRPAHKPRRLASGH
jgi:hypothetical protein